MTTTYNTFQDSLIQYAGYTGSTGGSVIPTPGGLTSGGLKLAGSININGATASAEIVVPNTAKQIVVICNKFDLSSGSTSLGVFLEGLNPSDAIGVDIDPLSSTDQEFIFQAFSPNSQRWVGSLTMGGINGTDEAKTEMCGGTLLIPVTKVTLGTFNGDILDGNIDVLYS